MEKSVRVHRYARRVRKFTDALKVQLLEHMTMGNTIASFLLSIRNTPRAISQAAIHKQLSRDPDQEPMIQETELGPLRTKIVL
jgi:hypothetical protein